MANGRVKSGAAVLDRPMETASPVSQGPSRAELEATIAAIGKSQAVIEFKMDGTVITANDNFLKALGYTLDEIKGRHHSMFVDEAYRQSGEYREFWTRLNRGEYQAAEYKRIGKGGKEVWIQASYNPILDPNGKPFKVVKFATDVTEQKLINADHAGQIAAIGKAQAVIEFKMDGTVITANDNFLKTLGYSLDEIRGRHHSMFVDEAYRQSGEYREFWARLNRGEYQAAEYKRIGKGGREVWIQASYNPIFDLNGKPFKVVKFATDVTEQKLVAADHAGQIAAASKSQAVIQFKMDGTVITANDNFLKTLGYTLDEIQGRHHSMFVDETFRQSGEYREFWAKLNRGEYQAAEYKRIGKGGKEVWIQASYNPIFDLNGKPFKVVKFAIDVTLQKQALNAMLADAAMLTKAAVEGKLATRADASKHQGDFRKVVEGVNATLDAVIGPLNVSAEYVDRISKGDIPPKITDAYNGDFNEIKNNLNNCIDNIHALVTDAGMLVKAAVEGKLATRADASKHQGDFRKVVEGVNATLDAVIGPLNVSAEYVDRISKGDIPPKITDAYNGDFNEIKNNLNNCIDNIHALVTDAGMLVKAAVEGKLATRADASKHQGDFRKVVEGVNQTLDAVIGPLNVSAEYVDRISKGDIPPKITDTYNGDFNEIKNNLNNCIDNIRALVTDAGMLVKAAVDGKLATRADASKHQGDFRKVVEGVNQTLDAVIGPLNVSAEYVDRISKGDIPPKITDKYNGDFNEIKNNLNNCIDNITALVTETGALIKASAAGQLATRADATRHHGDFRKIVEGVNEMLDAILMPIGEGNRILAQISNGKIDELIAQTYHGDHEKMKQAVNNVATVIQGLQKELGRLTVASREGLLSERGKPEQFQGAYAGIVKGVNEMLDAILLPIGEGNRILAQISNGKIDELIAQTYHGDHEKMKQAVNNVATVIQGLQKELGRLTEASRDGLLSERGKPDQFQGAYAGIVKGVNQMLDAILLPIGEGNRILAQISNGRIDELIAQTYKGDHEKMKQAVNGVATTLQNMSKDVNVLVKAAVEGKLATRADATKHQGEYRKIVEGVNQTLDAVIGPLNVSAEYVDRISKGDIPPKITDTYNGDFNDNQEQPEQLHRGHALSQEQPKCRR